MASRDKMDLLRTFLGSLPAGLAGKVAHAVEVDRLNEGRMLPHDLILESLRPTLRGEVRSERAQTPMRLFCRPFEDLLVNEPRQQKQKGQISRSSITPVWNWLAQDLIPDVVSSYSMAVKTAAMGCADGDLREPAVGVWKTASSTLRAKLANDSGRRTARQALGSDAVIEDACEMAIMLQAGPEICDLQDSIAHRLPSLTEGVIRIFRDMHDRVIQHTPQVAPYLALVVMRRLEHPWEALRLTDDPDMGLVGEVLFGAIEKHAAAILAAGQHRFSADSIISHVEGFTVLSSGAATEVAMHSDAAWSQRLVKDRAAVAEAMDGFMDRALDEIFMALPSMASSHDVAARVPDLSRPADAEKSDSALSYARLVAGCRPFAAGGSFAASLKRADEKIGSSLKSYNEEIVRALANATDEERFNAEQFAALATELTAILFSPEEGEFLRRRGRAAMMEPVAA